MHWHSLPPIIFTMQWKRTDKSGPARSCQGVCLQWWGLYRCKAFHVCMHARYICEWLYMQLVVWLTLFGIAIDFVTPFIAVSPRALAFITTNGYHHAIVTRKQQRSTQFVQVRARNNEACIGVTRCMYACSYMYVNMCVWLYLQVVCAIGFGVANDFVRPVIAAITTCVGIHYHQSLSPCSEHA